MESFRYRDALAKGVGRGALQGPSFEQPFWGVRARGPIETATDLARAFALRLPERGFFFGPTAAMLHGIPLPLPMSRQLPLHVGVMAGLRRIDPKDIVAHHVRICDADLTLCNGLRVTSPSRTWCDLAASGGLDLGQLVAAGDRIRWRRAPLASQADLELALSRYEGRRGIRAMRLALPLLSDRADSPPESEIRTAIWARGLPTPLINCPIRDARGALVATPDFSWPEHMVLLEYEGDHHRVDAHQWHHDVERFGRTQEIGWVSLRATAQDYRSPHRLLTRLERVLSQRSPR